MDDEYNLEAVTIALQSGDREAALRYMNTMKLVYPLHEFRLVWARRQEAKREKTRLADRIFQ